MKKISKLFSLLICIVMMSSLFVGCSKSQTSEINFFNYGENIDDETLKEFEEKYNIKVNMETFDDMEAMYSKVKSGAGKYDVILVSDALMPRMIEQKLVQKLNKDNIPNISQMDEQYLNLEMDPGNEYSVPYMFGTVGIIYNTDVVKEDVDSWDILWDKKYKDKIFMFDTYRDTIGAALKKLGYSLNSTSQKEIDEAKELLLQQRKLVNPLYGVDNGTTMIPAGETDGKLRKVVVIANQNKFEEIKLAMEEIGITGMTVIRAHGCGMQKGNLEYYRGVEMEMKLLPKVKIEIVICEVPLKVVIETLKRVLHTGNIGDGKIFVYDVDNAIKIRTGEEGREAIM